MTGLVIRASYSTVRSRPLWASLVAILAIVSCGCQPRRDPYAEHLLEQRDKAMKQLEQKAQRDKSFDLLCWDISPHIDKPLAAKKWATSHKGLDVLAMSGPDYAKLKQAADMAEVIESLDRGWPAVTGTNAMDVAQPPSQYYVMNANGYRFDGVVTDPITDWSTDQSDDPGRPDPPTTVHLQVRYTPYALMLVYMTNSQAVSASQWKALSNWIDQQTVPVMVFGQFETARLENPGLVTIDADRLVVSKSLEPWQFSIEELESPLGDQSHPYMIRCKEILPITE